MHAHWNVSAKCPLLLPNGRKDMHGRFDARAMAVSQESE